MLKRRIATVGVLILLLIGTVGALSSCVTKSIDNVWIAKLETDKSSDTGKSVTISGVMPKYLNQRELVIPERIGGHPVKKLFKFRQLFTDASSGSARLGELRRLTIEASVEIVGQFFNESKVCLIEFTNLTPSVFYQENSWLPLVIIPDGSSEDYLQYESPNRKSDVVFDGYIIIKNGTFMGYIGEERDLKIPDNVSKIGYDFYMPDIDSIKFPETLSKIPYKTSFRDCKNITVIISNKTIIEDGAFDSSVNIIRY
jgi:hypothetical protein